jgi:hypothetical protein
MSGKERVITANAKVGFHAACPGFLLTISDSSSTNALSFSSAFNNETFSIAWMCVCNPDRSAFGING